MAPDLNSLPPSRSPVHTNGLDRRQPASPSPRSSSVSLAAAATINAGIQHQDSRRSSISSRSNQQPSHPGRSERRRSNVAMNLSLNDPTLPGPGELQSSDHRTSLPQPFRTASPQSMASPTTAPPHHRAPSLGELHQELEQEQEAQVVSHGSVQKIAMAWTDDPTQNRLLEMIRQQQLQLQQMQQHANFTPATSTAAVDNSTPTSERSFSFPSVPASAPSTSNNPRPRSPAPPSSLELSRQSSRASRTPSRGGSPLVRPMSSGLQSQSEEWMLPGGSQSGRDDLAYYQAETQMLTRENQMLKMRIRELGWFMPPFWRKDANVKQNDNSTTEIQQRSAVPATHRTLLRRQWMRTVHGQPGKASLPWMGKRYYLDEDMEALENKSVWVLEAVPPLY
ncbi:MAG: hypothetical protein LQ344_001079 [Seirophora lacunosa]|nr:MAG: hypothetical protein LQ344_001079 [Seirophora lacunosa]